MKKIKLLISILLIVVSLFLLLHSTPKMALRTNVFFMGYPKPAITSEIVDYDYLNIKFEENNSRGYAFAEPPIEQATQGILDTYRVKKVGFIYFAEYTKDI